MRNLLLLALALVLLAGCKKASNKANPSKTNSSGEGMSVHAPTGVVINPGLGGGGSGGAAQAVRKAAARAVSQNELRNIHLYIENASLSGQMPSAPEITQALMREAPATYKLIQEGAIVLTGTRSRESVWAYTKEAQSTTGEHLMVSNNGVGRITPQELNARLSQQR